MVDEVDGGQEGLHLRRALPVVVVGRGLFVGGTGSSVPRGGKSDGNRNGNFSFGS